MPFFPIPSKNSARRCKKFAARHMKGQTAGSLCLVSLYQVPTRSYPLWGKQFAY
jgi:hypothetical protein